MPFFYMSFCDVDRPAGQKFLGATVIEAADVKAAVTRSHRIGVNPGGEVAIWELPSPLPTAGAHYLDRFVPRAAVMAEGGALSTAAPTAGVCQKHNDPAA